MPEKLALDIDVYEKEFLIIKNNFQDSSLFSSYAEFLYNCGFEFIDEVIFTEKEICLKLNSRFQYTNINQLTNPDFKKNEGRQKLKLPVLFEVTDDFEYIKQKTGFNDKEIIQKLVQTEYTVSMLGFLPGFIYLKGLDKALWTPRKHQPKMRVSARSFAIASEYAGIYSVESPGGWYILGKVACSVINIPKIPPVLLHPGDKVMIEAIDINKFKALSKKAQNILEYNGIT